MCTAVASAATPAGQWGCTCALLLSSVEQYLVRSWCTWAGGVSLQVHRMKFQAFSVIFLGHRLHIKSLRVHIFAYQAKEW